MERLKIEEVIVVEGIHDKQAVLRVVDADIWVLGGDRIAHRLMAELKRAANRRGLLILTDPDGPGERIRRRLDDAFPGSKHAFLAKDEAFGDGAIGVEHASDEAIRKALQQVKRSTSTETEAGASTSPASTLDAQTQTSAAPISNRGAAAGGTDARAHAAPHPAIAAGFTTADLIHAGLAGDKEAAKRRALVGDILGIGYGNAKAFLHKLNALGVLRSEWEHALAAGGFTTPEVKEGLQ